ncbi:MAG: IS1634 family transposase [Candidatus Omnitrophica bacterium]|nr:IS1634 family transposase [Candidatus Omnitrophota bacterium]
MLTKLEEKIQGSFEKEELEFITEKVDDVVLLIAYLEKMDLRKIMDKYIPFHWKQRELSWGWTAVIWLAYILSEGDHRKVKMEIYVRGAMNTLRKATGQPINPLDFSDDRLSHLLSHLSKANVWEEIERELAENSIEVFELPAATVRCDASTISGYHVSEVEGLMQFGHSKDNGNLPQIKIMSGALDPLGMPLITEVVSGEKADDILYIPVIEKIRNILKKDGLLFVSDCKGSALKIRSCIVEHGNRYLSPLPLTGNTAKEMEAWITDGIKKRTDGCLEFVYKENAKGEKVLVAEGYELERIITVPQDNGVKEWTERVFVIKSPAYGKQQEKGLEKRLKNAQEKINKLTPPRGKGRRQITEEKALLEGIERIIEVQKVEGLLEVKYEKEIEIEEKYKGKGRGSAKRKKRKKEKVRYQITGVHKNEIKIEQAKERFGWKAFVTSACKEEMSLSEAILCYRKEYRVERIFNRLKSRLKISPLYVKNDDQIIGLTNLLILGTTASTLLEFVVRRSLEKDKAGLPDLHPENKIKKTNKPTAERILKAFSGIYLNIIKTPGGNDIIKLTALSELQKEILQRSGLDENVYLQLET